MIKYPKVPRYELPFVSDWFWSGEVIATEKVDGSLVRFVVFDSNYEDWYPDTVMDFNPEHGDVVVGNSQDVQWVIRSDGAIDGRKQGGNSDVLSYLSENVDVDPVLDYHDEYDGPFVWFGESLEKHLLEYSDDTTDFLGFDVYAPAMADRTTVGMPEEFKDSNPYDLRWDGFFECETAFNMFKRIGLETVHEPGESSRMDAEDIDLDDFVVPMSQYGDMQAEGVVFRNPEVNQRVKIRGNFFKEVKNHHQNENAGGEDPPTDRFIAKYCSKIRIVKTALKMVDGDESKLSMEMTKELGERVYADIWEEEWRTMKELNYPIIPGEIKARVTRKSGTVLEELIHQELDVLVFPEDIESAAPFEF